MKFKSGDRIRVTSGDAEMAGLIKATSFNSIRQEDEYVIVWDRHPSQHCSYSTHECDRLWELENPNLVKFDVVLKPDTRPFYIKEMQDKATPEMMCNAYNHTWKTYNSGFSLYDYCSVCDVKRES